MALNLIRNSRVFVTTNIDGDGKVKASGFSPTNTWEVQVQDGFSFSQNTTQETVTLNEAGSTPIRGQRSFNTALDPVEWSFATYIRPKYDEGSTTTAGVDANDVMTAEEGILWNCIAAPNTGATSDIGGVDAAWVETVGGVSPATLSFTKSNANQLKAFGLIIVFEAVTYVIHNCAVESASIDFGLDAIASVAWTGRGTTMEQLATTVSISDVASTRVSTFTGGLTGTARYKDVNAKYLANKLSTLSITRNAFDGLSSKPYTIALTGGNLTITNNLTYLTPANLGVVNVPVTYFAGTRAVTASVNAYLKTGTAESAELLKDMLATSTNDENQYSVVINIGGTSASTTRVELAMPTAMLSIPSVSSEQVISTSINIMPQAATGSVYDIEKANELTIKYYATAT